MSSHVKTIRKQTLNSFASGLIRKSDSLQKLADFLSDITEEPIQDFPNDEIDAVVNDRVDVSLEDVQKSDVVNYLKGVYGPIAILEDPSGDSNVFRLNTQGKILGRLEAGITGDNSYTFYPGPYQTEVGEKAFLGNIQEGKTLAKNMSDMGLDVQIEQ